MSDDSDRPDGRPVLSRSVLGALLALLILAVLIALWALITRSDNNGEVSVDTTTNSDEVAVVPTPIPIPTSTPAPPTAVAETVEPTPTVPPTPVPDGFEACGDERAPLLSATYIVDTLSTPLNQRGAPAVDADLMGSFDPGERGLVFNGECIVNLADGYVWWQINNGSDDVWVASTFVTPN